MIVYLEDIIIQVPEHVTAFLRNLSNKIITLDNVIPPSRATAQSKRQTNSAKTAYI